MVGSWSVFPPGATSGSRDLQQQGLLPQKARQMSLVWAAARRYPRAVQNWPRPSQVGALWRACSTQESRPCASPRQHSGAGPSDGIMNVEELTMSLTCHAMEHRGDATHFCPLTPLAVGEAAHTQGHELGKARPASYQLQHLRVKALHHS